MTYSLLVWDNVDADLLFFVIPDHVLSADDLLVLAAADGRYVNAGDNTDEQENALQHVSDWISEDCSRVGDPKNGWLVQYKVKKPGAFVLSSTYVMGFLP